MSLPKYEEAVKFFWEHVNKTDGCWLWTGTQNISGKFVRGIIYVNGYIVFVHRFSYELHYGKILDDSQVLHKCDVMLCVRPEHLFKGTQKDNMNDMYYRGRWPFKLTSEQVAQIRLDHLNGTKIAPLARRYNVSWTCIYRIVRNVSRQLY